MKARDIDIGRKYVAKVSGKLATVRVDNIHVDWQGRVRYGVTNLRSGRCTTFRSPQKFRWAYNEPGELSGG